MISEVTQQGHSGERLNTPSTGCFSYLSHQCDQVFEKKLLREKGFILAHGLKGYSPSRLRRHRMWTGNRSMHAAVCSHLGGSGNRYRTENWVGFEPQSLLGHT